MLVSQCCHYRADALRATVRTPMGLLGAGSCREAGTPPDQHTGLQTIGSEQRPQMHCRPGDPPVLEAGPHSLRQELRGDAQAEGLGFLTLKTSSSG